MADYIKRNQAVDILIDKTQLRGRPLEDAVNAIRDLPAADVVEVRHGRWVLTTQPLGWRDEDCVECSECGEDFVLDEWGIDDVKDAMKGETKMLNENCCAVPVEGIGSKAKSVSELLEAALIDAEGVESFLFGREPTDRKPPVAKCLDDEMNVIREKAEMLAAILSSIRGHL